VLFEDNNCVIKDAKGIEVFKVQIKNKSFVLGFRNNKHVVIHK
jgi:hypothetical protein